MPGEQYNANKMGHCPYCGGSAFNPQETTMRRPGQSLMKCDGCSKWSVRQRGTQYPLQDPTDSSSSPATATRT